MPTLQASKLGLSKIRQARRERGWAIEDDRWLREASKVLEPDANWEAEDYVAGRIFAPGISLPTWKRFLEGTRRINAGAFKAFCQVLGLNWLKIVDSASSNVLHLSDLHFGTTDNARIWYAQLAEDLRYELNCSRLDALTALCAVIKYSRSKSPFRSPFRPPF